MTPIEAVNNILDDKHSSLQGEFYDVSEPERRKAFVWYMVGWWNEINLRMESSV